MCHRKSRCWWGICSWFLHINTYSIFNGAYSCPIPIFPNYKIFFSLKHNEYPNPTSTKHVCHELLCKVLSICCGSSFISIQSLFPICGLVMMRLSLGWFYIWRRSRLILLIMSKVTKFLTLIFEVFLDLKIFSF